MKSLYELSNEMTEILENGFNAACIDEETGEIDEDKVSAYLSNLSVSFDEKADSIASYVKDLNATAKAIKEEEKNLEARRKRAERKAESLKNYLSVCMQASGRTKFESARNVISFRKSESVTVYDESILPKDFMVEKITVAPDKKAIVAAIKGGEIIEGAKLETNYNIQIK